MKRIFLQLKSLKEKGFFHLIVSNYSIQIIVFVSHILIAKIMNPTYVGIIKTIETYISIGIVLGSGGVILVILKFIPQQQDEVIRKQIFSFSIRYIFWFSLIIFLFFELFAFLGWLSNDLILIYWFKWYALIIVPSVFLQFLIRFYQAVEEFKKISILIFYFKIVSFVIVLSLTYFFFIKGYIFSMIITTTITVGYLLYDLKDAIFLSRVTSSYKKTKKDLLKLSKQSFVAQLIDQLKLQGGYLIANFIILDRYMFGQYSFALIIVQGLNLLSTSIQQFTTPKLSSIANKTEVFSKQLKKFEIKFISVSFIIFVIAQIFLSIIISYMFGNKFNEAILLLRILLVGWLISTFFTLKFIVFISFGKIKYISYTSIITLLIILPISFYLNKYYGVYGTSYTFVIQNIVTGILLVIFSKKVLKEKII